MATVQLRCDGCGATRQAKPGQKLSLLRIQLGRIGWRSSKSLDRDLCPTCVTRRAAVSV